MAQNNKYHAILFDWDGTLAQTIPVWEKAFTSVFNSLHMPIDVKHTTEQLWLDSAILNDLGIEHEGFFDLVYEQLAHDYFKTALYEGAVEIIAKLKELDFKLAVVTSTRKKPINSAIQYHQLESYFQVIIASEDVALHKPNAQPYELAVGQLGSEKSSVLIIGDSRFDLLGSANAKIDSVLFLPKENEKYYNKEYLLKLKPNYVITNYQDLIKILE